MNPNEMVFIESCRVHAVPASVVKAISEIENQVLHKLSFNLNYSTVNQLLLSRISNSKPHHE